MRGASMSRWARYGGGGHQLNFTKRRPPDGLKPAERIRQAMARAEAASKAEEARKKQDEGGEP